MSLNLAKSMLSPQTIEEQSIAKIYAFL